MSAEAAQVLEDVAQYIDDHGWIQREYCSETGEVCTYGAFNRVAWAGSGHEDDPTFEALMALRGQVGDIYSWNDRFGQTKEQVTETLRKVAAELKEEGK